MNLKIKFRESFRPFAPIVMSEHAHEWFEIGSDQESPYMLIVAPVLEKLRELSTAKGLQCLLVTHATNLSHLFESAIELEAPELRHVQRS
jgi:predicted NodU family carbamoyl transferase